MPRALEPFFAEETAKPTQAQLFHLVEVQYPYINANDQGGWLFFVDSNYDITFGGQLYTRFPLKFNGASVNTDGTIDQASITIANVSRDLMYYIDHCNGLRNMRVKVKAVYANALDYVYTCHDDGSVTTNSNLSANSNAYIEDEYLIDNYQANETVISFQLYPIIDLEIKLPRRRYMNDSCYWIYGDPSTCKYDRTAPGALTTCAKNLADCKNHGKQTATTTGLTADLVNNSSLVHLNGTWTLPNQNQKWILKYQGYSNEIFSFSQGGSITTLRLHTNYTGPTITTSSFSIESHGNEVNFGGFPGISGSRRIYL